MYPLLLFFFGAIYFILERMISYFIFNWKADFNISDIEDIDKNITAHKKNRFFLALRENLKSFGNDSINFNETMESDCQGIISYLQNNLNYLVAIASLAPITGFLGTVTGMIVAFGNITKSADVSPQLVAGGIYEALITTAAGLIITIFTSIFYFIYSGRIKNYSDKMEKTVNHIIKEIKRKKQNL